MFYKCFISACGDGLGTSGSPGWENMVHKAILPLCPWPAMEVCSCLKRKNCAKYFTVEKTFYHINVIIRIPDQTDVCETISNCHSIRYKISNQDVSASKLIISFVLIPSEKLLSCRSTINQININLFFVSCKNCGSLSELLKPNCNTVSLVLNG